MKAILVIDMPKNCEECNYCGFYQDDMEERACLLIESHFIGKLTEGERDVACPLRPLPEKLYVEANQIEDLMPSEFDMDKLILKIQLDADKLCALGWNACLKEITGETE